MQVQGSLALGQQAGPPGEAARACRCLHAHSFSPTPFILVPDDRLEGTGLFGYCFCFSGLPRPSPTFASWLCWGAPDGGGLHHAECPCVAILGDRAAEQARSPWRHRRVPSWGGGVTSPQGASMSPELKPS